MSVSAIITGGWIPDGAISVVDQPEAQPSEKPFFVQSFEPSNAIAVRVSDSSGASAVSAAPPAQTIPDKPTIRIQSEKEDVSVSVTSPPSPSAASPTPSAAAPPTVSVSVGSSAGAAKVTVKK